MKKLLRIALAAALVLSAALILARGLQSSKSGSPASRDFIAYWSAGQLLVHHGNPYDAADVFRVERQAGYTLPGPSVMMNPPWTLFLVILLGWVNSYFGAMAWTLAVLACIIVSVRLLWSLNGRPRSDDHLLGYAFAPTLACLMAGSMAAFALLGLALFLRFRETRPFAAGMACALLAIKPHVFVFFGLILLLECLRRRDLRVLWGGAAALVVSLGAVLTLDPPVFSQYIARMSGGGIENPFVPTMAFLLRLLVHREWGWLQAAPECVAGAWAAWFYFRRRKSWAWESDGMLVILVSLFAAPYATFLDEVVLMPAVLQIFLRRGKDRALPRFAAAVFWILNGTALVLLISGVPIMTGEYIWTSTGWLVWYLYSSRKPAAVLLRAAP